MTLKNGNQATQSGGGEMKVKDLIWKLQQVHNQDKEVLFGNVNLDKENRISGVIEKDFFVFIKEY